MAGSVATFRVRLAEAARGTDLPAQSQFNLASSSIDHDTLERAVEPFGAPYGATGFGTSEVMSELLSRDPNYLKVDDLKGYQQNLASMGYAYDVPIDGQWNDYWAASDRRASRDAMDTVRTGGSYLSAPAVTLFRYIGYTIPSEVFKGLYGIATGIVEDAMTTVTHPVEAFEQGGALGGAGIGAGIGATAGLIGGPLAPLTSTAGALIGAAAGGVAGFFADFFDDDENEDGLWQRVLGALSPVDEIKSGDAKEMFAALSTVMLAASILKSLKVAKVGVQAGLAQPVTTGAVGGGAGGFAVPTFEQASKAPLSLMFQGAAKGTVAPGLLNVVAQKALQRRILGSALAGGVIDSAPELLQGDFGQAFKDFGKGALIGGTIGAGLKYVPGVSKVVDKVAEKTLMGLEAAPLARAAASPVGNITRSLYTGLLGPTITSRAVADVSGADLGNMEGGSDNETSIGRAIHEAPETGVAGVVVDLTIGTMIYPTRILPWKGKEVAEGIAALSSNHELIPVARAIAAKEKVSISEGMRLAREYLGKSHVDGSYNAHLVSVRNTEAMYQKGLDDLAGEGLKLRTDLPEDPTLRQPFFAAERAKIHAGVMEEATSTENLLTSPKAVEIIERVKNDPVSMEAWWGKTYMDSSGPGFASERQKAEEFLQVEADKINNPRPKGVPEEAIDYNEGADVLDDLGSVATKARTNPLVASPAIKGVYLTAQDFEGWGGKGKVLGTYERTATELRQAEKNLRQAEEAGSKGREFIPKGTLSPVTKEAAIKIKNEAATKYDAVLVELKKRGVLSEEKYAALRADIGTQRFKVDRDFINQLQEYAKVRPRELPNLTQKLAQNGQERYIAVATGENLVHYGNFDKMANVNGITEYSRHRGWMDAMASLGAETDRLDIGRLRYQSIVRHLDLKAAELTDYADGKTLTDLIYDYTRGRYEPDVAKRYGAEVKVHRGGVVTRTNKETGKVTRELFKIDPRDLTPEHIIEATNLDAMVKEGKDVYDAAHQIKRALHVGSAFGADIAHPLQTARMLGNSLRLNGLQGFGDFVRTTTIAPRAILKKGMELDDPSLWGKFTKGSYGYLPQNVRRAHMAVQFSMNPLFDAGRYMEAMAFGKMEGSNIPLAASINPRRFIGSTAKKSGFVSPLTGQRVTSAAEATAEMVLVGEKTMHGGFKGAQNIDELQYRILGPGGILGFNPRETEYAQAYWELSRRAAKGPVTAKDYEEVRDIVLKINQYGSKQTALGNSAHFIFFPFLFTKKQVTAIAGYGIGAPTRNLLVHEGFRRWYTVQDDDTLSAKFARFMEKHIPLAKELERINNLAYGISPGRFFLEGIMDKDTEGKVAQALTSFFVPGGVHTPVGDTAGAVADSLKQFFVPQVWAVDGGAGSKHDWKDLAERLLPVYRDVNRWFFDNEQSGSSGLGLVGAQVTAMTNPEGSPYAQLTAYLDEKRVLGAGLETIAAEMGFSSWDSLRGSEPELAKQVNEIDLELGGKYPQGKALSLQFTNSAEVKDQVIYQIAEKPTRTEAEEAILVIGLAEQQLKEMAAQAGRTQEEVLRMGAPIVRQLALGFVDNDQFMNLYDALYKAYYGPLRTPAVAS